PPKDRRGTAGSVSRAPDDPGRGIARLLVAAVAGAAAGADPVGHLLGHPAHLISERGDVLAHLAEDGAEALGVELDRVAGLLAHVGLLVAPAVLAALDAVVVAALHPLHDLRDAADSERV